MHAFIHSLKCSFLPAHGNYPAPYSTLAGTAVGTDGVPAMLVLETSNKKANAQAENVGLDRGARGGAEGEESTLHTEQESELQRK